MYGCYCLANDNSVGQKVIDPSDINNTYILDNSRHFIKVTSDNYSEYANSTYQYVPAQLLEDFSSTSQVKFRIPYYGSTFLKMWTSGDSEDYLGQHREAGLPNIFGEFSGNGQHYGSHPSMTDNYVSGAFYRVNTTNSPTNGVRTGQSSDAQRDDIFGFDASLSSDVYGRSDTVTPENTSVRVFIKAYNGNIVPPDFTVAEIQALIRDEISVYTYATTSSPGLVTLASTSNGSVVSSHDPVKPSVLTADQFILENSKNVRNIEINGTTYTAQHNTIHMPSFAEKYGNNVAVLTMLAGEHINCTALKTTNASDRYYDFIIPSEIVDALNHGENINVCDTINATVSLKCIDSSSNRINAMRYPYNTVVQNPMCLSKAYGYDEELTGPSVVVFEDTVSYQEVYTGSAVSAYVTPKYVLTQDITFVSGKCYYILNSGGSYERVTPMENAEVPANTYYEVYGNDAESTNKRIIVRLYWPLLWYIKAFSPGATWTSSIYPLVNADSYHVKNQNGVNMDVFDTDALLAAIEAQLAYWTVIVKISI